MSLDLPLARNNDPITSHAAADAAQGFRLSQSACILRALEHLGPSTAHEISAHTRLTVVQIDRRMKELENTLKAKRTGVQRGNAMEWSLT